MKKGSLMRATIACMKQLEYAIIWQSSIFWKYSPPKGQKDDPKIGLSKFFKYETVSSVFAKND